MSLPTHEDRASSYDTMENPSSETSLARERIRQNTIEQHSAGCHDSFPPAGAETLAYDNMFNPNQPQSSQDKNPHQTIGVTNASQSSDANTASACASTQASRSNDRFPQAFRSTTDMLNVNALPMTSIERSSNLVNPTPTEGDSQATCVDGSSSTHDRNNQVDLASEHVASIDDREEIHVRADLDHIFYTQHYRRSNFVCMDREDLEDCERQGWVEEYHGLLQRLDEDAEDGRARWMGLNGMRPRIPVPRPVIPMESSENLGISSVSITNARFGPRRNRNEENQRRCC